MSESDRPIGGEAGPSRLPGKRLEPEGCPAVNPEHVKTLCSMGIPEAMAEKALLMTGGQSLEAATALYFDNQDDAKLEQEALAVAAGPPLPEVSAACCVDVRDDARLLENLNRIPVCVEQRMPVEAVKMVFVVNAELKMGKGKISAQVAHACLGLYRHLLQNQATYGHQLLQWETVGETKIVLSGTNAEHLQDLQRRASVTLLPSHLTQDAGKTEIPCGSCTVLSIFGSASKVDQVTGTLCLL